MLNLLQLPAARLQNTVPQTASSPPKMRSSPFGLQHTSSLPTRDWRVGSSPRSSKSRCRGSPGSGATDTWCSSSSCGQRHRGLGRARQRSGQDLRSTPGHREQWSLFSRGESGLNLIQVAVYRPSHLNSNTTSCEAEPANRHPQPGKRGIRTKQQLGKYHQTQGQG